MVRSKKSFLWMVVSVFCMLTSLFFVGCGGGDVYKNVSLISSSQSVSMYVGQTVEIEYVIENYIDDMDNTLNFSIIDSTSGSSSSQITGEHVSLKVITKNADKIKVEITGISSGRSSIIATTNEGFKQCVVDVTVKQYSKTFAVDQSKMMYVALGERMYPSSEFFVFDDGTTEKDVKYYLVPDETADLSGREFASVSFVQNGADKTVVILNSENEAISTINCEHDGQYIPFLAVYTYKEIDETGTEIDVTIKQMTKFVALFGINADDVQLYDEINKVLSYDGDSLLSLDKETHELELVANKVGTGNMQGLNTFTYYVTVPYVEDSLIDFAFEYGTSNKTAINFESKNITNEVVAAVKERLDANNLELYKVSVTSNSFTGAIDTEIYFQVYYSFDASLNFASTDDKKVNYRLITPVKIKLMPEIVEITDQNKVVLSDNKGSNVTKEIYYNYYVSDYGWVEYDVNVYKPSSTFSGVRVEFDPTIVNIIYDGKTFNSTYSFIMTDLSKPLYIRGVEGIEAGVYDPIKFTVESELISGADNLEAFLNFEIKDGASSLTYETIDFDAKLGDGIYVSSSQESNTFINIYADKEFKYFQVEALNPGIVSIGNLLKVEKPGKEGVPFLSMEISPIKTGEANYIVRLDNGVSTALKVKVVNTFDDLSIALDGTNPDVVSFGEEGGVLTAVIRNTTSYNKQADFILSSTHNDSILSVRTEFDPTQLGVCSLISYNDMLKKTVETRNRGTTTLEFTVIGVGVDDFYLRNDEVKTLEVQIISFVPVTDVQAFRIDPNTNTSVSAEKVVVYAQANAETGSGSTEIVSNTAYLNVEISPDDAYYFYDESTKAYVGDPSKTALNYLYWTLSDGVYAYDVNNTTIRLETMQKGKSYYISGGKMFSYSSFFGTFEYDELLGYYKFIANPTATSGAVFTIYASIRQFGLKKYYPIQIECREFVAVEQIYTTSSITNYSFKNADEKLEFAVYLNPYESTVDGVRCLYVTNAGPNTLLNPNDITVTPLKTTTSKAYLVSVKMSQDTLNSLTDANATYAGTLYIVPNDWYNSNYDDINGIDFTKRSRVVKIGINFQNGTRGNPYVLSTAEEVVAINSSERTKKAHYILYDMIDMSTVTSTRLYLITDSFQGSIRGATENAGFENIRLINSTRYMFEEVARPTDGGFSFDNLIFSGSINISFSATGDGNVGLIAGRCSGDIINTSVVIDEASRVQIGTSNTGTINIGLMVGTLTGTIKQDFKRNYINLSGAMFGADLVNSVGGNGTTHFPIDSTNRYEIIDNEKIIINAVEHKLLNVSKITAFSEQSLIVAANSQVGGVVNVGGMVGSLTGNITKVENAEITHFNYSGYTAFVDVQVTGDRHTNLGGVVGDFNGGSISGVLIGGQAYFAIQSISSGRQNYVGGFAGRVTSNLATIITNSTTRTFVRGYTVGLIVGFINTGSRTLGNLKVQAVDDGKRAGVDASMLTRLTNQSASTSNPNAQDGKLADLLQGGGSEDLTSSILSGNLQSYVTRDRVPYYTTSGSVIYASTTAVLTTQEYYGDAILVQVNSGQKVGTITAVTIFDKLVAGGMNVDIVDYKKFSTSVVGTYSTYTYFYDANAYYEDGLLVYSNLIEIQDLLDSALNNLVHGNENYPFEINGDSVMISSESKNISIDINGNIQLKGVGLAVIDVSSMLNQNSVVKIYLFVVNYFDVDSYRRYVENVDGDKTQSLFYIDSLPLNDGTEFNVVSDDVINVTLNMKTNQEFEIDGNAYSVINGGIISIENRSVKLENANKSVNYNLDFKVYVRATGLYDENATYYTYDGTKYIQVPEEDMSEEDFDSYFVKQIYGQTSKYDDGFFFSKNTEAQTSSDSYDMFDLNARLSFVDENGKGYNLTLADIQNIKAKYYEGASSITTNYGSYVLVTGKVTQDIVYMISDTDENLICEIMDKNGQTIIIRELTGTEVLQDPACLFTISSARKVIDGNSNCFQIGVEINKNSTTFKNRFEENIYGTYAIRFYSTSHGLEGIYKTIPIIFEEQNVNTISMTSYNDLDKVLDGEALESEFIVPMQTGVLAVSFAPIDADFDYIYFENTDINKQAGGSTTSFVIGYIGDDALGGKSFYEISGAQSIGDGVRISKASLERIENFSGNFYVKYLFGSYRAENNAPVQIKSSVYKNGVVICEETKEFKLNIKYALGLKLNGYENKTRVARGLSYELEIMNTGFNAETLDVYIPVEYVNIASLTEKDGKYKLNISNAEIDYDGAPYVPFIVEVKASYTDSLGELKEEVIPLELQVLEYVINYNYGDYEAGDYQDIISGMTNGVVSTAIGEKTTLSVDFNNYSLIEYNPDNTEVAEYVELFIDALNRGGTWTSYIDANTNGVQIYPNPITDKDKAVRQEFGYLNAGTSNMTNVYFSNSGLSFRTRRTHSVNEKHYIFSYLGGYDIQEGKYVFAQLGEGVIYTEFTFDSFIRGSDEHPNPIYNYDDLKAMSPTGHYILLNDIYVTNDNFEPIRAEIASFDGNGYKFIFSNYEQNSDNMTSAYDMTALTEIGIFANVADGAIIKNVTVQIGDQTSGDVVFNTSSSATITAGLVASTNNGVITNAKVLLAEDINFSIVGNASSSSIMGGVVGSNEGYLTHSQSYLSVDCPFNVGGVVGKNSGMIASSFYKGGVITNNVSSSTTSIYTAGFAVDNTGKISTSYTLGEREDINYASVVNWGTLDYNINSNVQSSGFVYNNGVNGEIVDCYSNLIVSSKSQSAGFVYVNNGKVSNSLSFSLVNPSSTTDYGFAGGDSIGTFENCAYIRSDAYNINKSQNFTTIVGIDAKDIADYAIDTENETDVNSKFTTYSYSTNSTENLVWKYDDALGRLDLVDANIIAFSQKEINEENTIQNEDGTYIYDYQTCDSVDADGSRNNPYVINTPAKFESYISNGQTAGKHFRIVCDLDYQNVETDFVTTYDVTFGGYLYGNSMTISNMSLYSDETLESAGLFAEIVGQPTMNASVKDLTIKPAQISFANAKYVGTIAGRASYADLTNITVLGSSASGDIESEEEISEDLCVVIGKNIVGGVVGMATNDYSFKNIEAKISVMAKQITTSSQNLTPTNEEKNYLNTYISLVSYAGGVVGFLAGTGTIQNVEIKSSSIVTIGSSIGMMFGFIGKNATAKNLLVSMNSNMIMRSAVYGGIIAGGSFGDITNVEIKGTASDFMLFAKVPYIPVAVGSVAGLASGGKISNVYLGQNLTMPTVDGLAFDAVDSVGGVVGLVTKDSSSDMEISKVVLDASLTATNYLGGVVGRVEESATLTLREIAIKEIALSLKGRFSRPMLGNFVGLCSGNIFVYDSYSRADLVVDIFDYEVLIMLGIGEIFGKVGTNANDDVDLSLVKIVKNVFTDNDYSISLADLSETENKGSVSFSSAEGLENATGGRDFSFACDNTYNASMASGFSYVQTEDRKHDVHYFLLESGGNTDVSSFATAITGTAWINILDDSDNIIDVKLAFEDDILN